MNKSSSNCYRGWKNGEFQIHFIHTGVGESIFLIFPDSTSMLLDCGDQPSITRRYAVPALPSPTRLAGEWIARYVARVNPRAVNVDWFVLSHFHSDHAGTPRWQKYPREASIFPGVAEPVKPIGGCARSGIGLAADFLRFRHATDRGWPTYADPIPLGRDGQEQPEIASHVRAVWKSLQQRDNLDMQHFRIGALDQFVPEHGDAPGFSVFNICANGRIAMPNGSVRDLYADWLAHGQPDAFNENGMSLGMVFRYGDFSFATFGDFSDKIPLDGNPEFPTEDALAKAVPRCNVAKLNHHGHHSTCRALATALKPQAWVAPVWDRLHLTDDTAQDILDSIAPNEQPPLILPTVLPVREDGERPWWRLVPAPCHTGCHVVITVAKDAPSYTIDLLDARDEEMRILQSFEFGIKG